MNSYYLRLLLQRAGKLSPPALFQSASYRTVERTFLSADGSKRPVAGLFTAPTGLGAHPAVLHVHLPGVVLALLAAQTARLGARLKSSLGHRRLEVRLTRDDPPRRGAHIRAVEAHGDTAPQMANLFLAEAGVGAGATRLGTVEACFYALHQCVGINRYGARVGIEHLPGVGHRCSSFLWPSLMSVYMPVGDNRSYLGQITHLPVKERRAGECSPAQGLRAL